MATVEDAVEAGLVADQTAYSFRQIKRAALAHPMTEEVEPESSIAQIDEMRTGIQ
jgi:hypothetical protein